MAEDIRDLIFAKVRGKRYHARISANGDGILSGTERLRTACKRLGIRLITCKKSGARVRPGDVIGVFEGDAKQIALAEEELIGWISKASGIATAALKAKGAAGKKLKVVSGAWKKMPFPIKELVRQAVVDGGIHYRISEKPFLYLDKNYLKMLGGVEKVLRSVDRLKGFVKVIQIKSQGKTLLQEATQAARMGAHIIMIDTGREDDINKVDAALRHHRLRHRVKIAFGGEISIEGLRDLKRAPVEMVDIGKAVVDAPLLDMRLDVIRKA